MEENNFNSNNDYSTINQEKEQPKASLGAAIASTILGGPFGIPAIVYSVMVMNLFKNGDYEGAVHAAEVARKWKVVAFVFGGIMWLLFFIYYIFLISLIMDSNSYYYY